MTDIHIDDFYKDVCRILVQLYNNFPRTTTLFVEDISGPDEPDEFGLHSARHQACLGAMMWMADSGYFRYDESIRQEALDQVILSHKAFTLLSAKSPLVDKISDDELPEFPESVQEHRESNIHALRQAIKSGSSIEQRRCGYQLLIQAKDYQ